MKYTLLGDKILYFEQAIENHRDIIHSLELIEPNTVISPWIEWGDKYSTSIEQSKSDIELYGSGRIIYNTQYDNNNKFLDTHWIYNSINDAIIKCSEIYALEMNIDVNSNPRIPGGGYIVGKYNNSIGRGMHIDCPYDELEHSYVVYLNDDYENGEIYFPEIDIKIKPSAGSVIMFKSSDVDSIHEAMPAKGFKYIIPHFWRMGPSQGFIPFGTEIKKHYNYISNKDNLIHDFDNLKVVNEKMKDIVNEKNILRS